MKYKLEFEHKEKDFEDVWYIEKEYLEPSTIAGISQVMKWENINHDIHIFVRDKEKDKIVGEITLIPLSENQFDKFMTNELEDTQINENTLLKYVSSKEYYLLFSTIAIDINYRNEKIILSYLLKGMNQKINELINKNIKFLNMCAEGQTSDGQKFITNFLDMTHKNTTKEGYKLYSFNNTEEFTEWLNNFPKYIEKYDSKI